MASFLSNLTYNITSGSVNSLIGIGRNEASKAIKRAFGKADFNAKFYYNYDDGGVWNVMAKKIVGGAIAYTEKYAIDQLKSALFKKKKILAGKDKSQLQELCDDANLSDGSNKDVTQKKYGIMKVNNGANSIVALDFVGNWCPDAVMLGIPVDPKITITQSIVSETLGSLNETRHAVTKNIPSDTLVWYDVTGLITINNERKLIITPVTGRDYSRKELMSNGDITFTISGRINSNLPDVYPTQEIQKFIQIMQYRGPVKIVSQVLAQYNIDKMVITGYSLPQKEGYRNIQEYTINCVGIQPAMDVKVTEDTIISLNREITEEVSKKDTMWSNLLKQTVDSLKTQAVSIFEEVASEGSGHIYSQIFQNGTNK